MKKYILMFLILSSVVSCFAEHIKSDGNGGFWKGAEHIQSDGNGGFWRGAEHIKSDGNGGFWTN